MSEDYQRETGKRVKQWGWEGDIDRLVEATGEYPIMYQALGSQPRTEHPFNVYGDIKTQPTVLRDTLDMNRDAVGPIADKIIGKGLTPRPRLRPGHVAVRGPGGGGRLLEVRRPRSLRHRFAGVHPHRPPVRFLAPGLRRLLRQRQHRRLASAPPRRPARPAPTRWPSRPSPAAPSPRCARTHSSPPAASTPAAPTPSTTPLAWPLPILLALALGERRQPQALDYAAVRRELFELPDRFAAMFDGVDARCHTLARRHKSRRAVLVVGSGANLGTAEEIALKYDEMGSIPTKAMCPGRHLHGAIGLTDEQILTILIAPPGPAYPQMIDIARATQMLKAPSIAIVSESDDQVSKLVDDVIRLPTEDEVLFSLLAILPGQLLPYWSAVEQGDINPDCQRSNIAKYARVWHMLFPPGTH